jgi:ribonuclease HII
MDEVGRGCLAGPVIVAAVVFRNGHVPIAGVADSKALTPKKREALAVEIQRSAYAWSIGRAEASEVDRYNVLNATLLAMGRAFRILPLRPDWLWVDGNRFPDIPCPGEAVIKGDQKIPVISCASILAKVFRDREMALADSVYPEYGFCRHVGYPTREHRLKLAHSGPSPLHRLSFGRKTEPK